MNRVFYIILLLGLVMGSFPSPGMAATDLGQLKVCKAIGIGVTKGDVFTFTVGTTTYDIPAGSCVLAGQYALNTQVAINEINIPTGVFVQSITIAPTSGAGIFLHA